MKIRISVSELSRAMNTLTSVAAKKTTMPILSNVSLVSTKDSRLILTATDLDVGIRLTKECEVIEEGASCISAKSLHDIVKMLPGPTVNIEALDNHYVSIKSGRTSARLLALPHKDFPKVDFDSDKKMLFADIESDIFISMIQKTIYSASLDDERYDITGVYFEPQADDENSLVMVSTDGHRLSKIKDKFVFGNFSKFSPLTFPKKGLSELIKLLDVASDKKEKLFKLGLSQRHAVFSFDHSSLFMRLIDKDFPAYNQVIPKLTDKIMRTSRQDFLLGLKRVSALAVEKGQIVQMSSVAGELTLSCQNPEAGEVTDDIAVEYNGPDIKIGLNPRYVIDALSSINDNNILIKFTDALSPILITGIKEDNHQCVIMPIRI
jgi:DNA polymerase-3 subunit beta